MRSDVLKTCVGSIAIAFLALVPAVRAQQQVPVGTSITVSLNQSVNSKDARAGQKLDGVVAANVAVNGKTFIRKGAKVNLSVANARMAGPLSAPALLLLQIDSIEVNKKTVTVSASLAGQSEQPETQRDATNRTGQESGVLVAGSSSDKGELVGASARSSANTENGSAGNRQRDITLAAKTKLRFTLRDNVQLK